MAMLERLNLKGKNQSKIRLGFYPYTYVRTIVMRTLLLKKEDYHKLLKMGFSEIASFLQESNYKAEIDSLATSYSGADLIEIALNKNLAGSFKKLMKISPNELGLLIREFAKRRDIDDIKTILRGRHTNSSKETILYSLKAAGTLPYEYLASLLQKKTIREILAYNGIIDFTELEISLKEFEKKNNLSVIENALDKSYYQNLLQFSKRLPKEGALFRDFLVKEVEVINLMTLLRLKKAGLDKDSIKSYMIFYDDKVKDSKLSQFAATADFEKLSSLLEKCEHGEILLKEIEKYSKTGSLISLESELYRQLLRQSTLFMHQHPLTIDNILGYMFAKDMEVRNLRIIVKGKQLGLSEDFIEKQLIF